MPRRVWQGYDPPEPIAIDEPTPAMLTLQVNTFREFEYLCPRCGKHWYQVSKNSEVPPEPVACCE